MNERLLRWERTIEAALIVFFGITMMAYNLGPMLEGTDELQHYAFVRYLVTEHALPDRTAEYRPEHWEFHQAPLYYVIGAVIRWPIPDADYQSVLQHINEFTVVATASGGWISTPPSGNFNHNRLLHTRAENFPYTDSGTALVTHLLRLYSTVLGLLTVLTCAAIFRRLWPEQPAARLMALGIVCTWPQFQYLSGSVNNDNLAILAATVCVYLCLRILPHGPTWRDAIFIGLAFGAALLAKANGILMTLPIAGAYLTAGRQHWRKGLLSAGVALAAAGWWYVRNTILYGDPSGLSAQYKMMPGLIPAGGHVPLIEMPARWLAAYRTVWGSFGATNSIPLPAADYVVYNALGVIAAAGQIAGAVRIWRAYRKDRLLTPDTKEAAVILLLGAAWIAGINFHMYTNEHGWYGRLVLPGIAAWSAGLAAGVLAWIPERFRVKAGLAACGLLVTISVSGLATVDAAYRPGPMPAQIESPRDLTYDQTIQLIGVSQDTVSARPGETAEFSLYWEALKTTDRAVMLDIHTYGQWYIAMTTLPGSGNLPSDVWQPGQRWAEHYRVAIPATAQPGEYVPVLVFLLYSDDRSLLPIRGPSGIPLKLPAVLQLTIEP